MDGRYGDVESLTRKSLEEVEVRNGADSIEVARVLDLLVEALCKGGKSGSQDVASFSRRALGIKRAALGPEDPEVAVSLRNLGVCYTRSGEYAKAKPIFEEALGLQERTLGAEHVEVAQTLNDFGIQERRTGNYSQAKEYFRRALGIREASFGRDHPLVAQTLNSLGILMTLSGDYAEARTLLERALDIDLKKLGPDHITVSNDFNQLGAVFLESGDYAAARRAFARALEIKKKVLDPRHPHMGVTLNNLGLAELHLGHYGVARPLLEQALEIQESALGPEHPDVAHQSRNNLARLARFTGDYDAAERLYRRSVAFQEKALGPSHPQLAETLTGLGKALKAEGRYSEAEGVYRKSVAIHEQSLGAGHPFLAGDLEDLAEVLAKLGKSEEALETALRAEEMGREHVRLTVRTLPEDQALRYAVVRDQGLDVALSLMLAERSPQAALPQVWNAVIRSRALVLDEMASRNHSQLDAGDPEVARLNERLASVRTRLAKLVVLRQGGTDAEPYPRLLERSLQEREAAERALAERSAVFRREREKQMIGFAEIMEALPLRSAVVAYVAFDQIDLASGAGGRVASLPSYTALLLASGRSEPEAVSLGPAAPIDALVQEWRTAVMSPPPAVTAAARRVELRYREAAERLRRAVWDPIAAELGDVRQVFIVPDGSLHLVNFATLPVGPQSYLVESGPNLHYLSAERDLVRSDLQTQMKDGFLAVGGPAYDAAGPGVGRPQAVAAARPFRGTHSTCGGFRSLVFQPLPAASREVREIAALWSKGKSSGVVSLTGARASEGAVKQMAGGFGVLHLATHGFFLGDCPSAPGSGEYPDERRANLPGEGDPESPLLLAGLALAGANHRSSAGPDEEDGILTSEEVASLDLSGVRWVVLSACDTGLGRIQIGEGVLGLRRSFETAGAKTLIMSLWPLDDQAAHEWMRALYGGRLKGLPTLEAVRGASLRMVQERRTAGRSTHPYFWGAMVASGDWR